MHVETTGVALKDEVFEEEVDLEVEEEMEVGVDI